MSARLIAPDVIVLHVIAMPELLHSYDTTMGVA